MGLLSPEGKVTTILNTIGDLIVLNLLTILCAIPVFTAGAAISSLYQITMQMAEKRDGKIVSSYFKAFKGNFRNSTLIWLIGGGISAFMAFDIYLLQQTDFAFGKPYRIVLFVLMLLVLMFTLFALATNAYFSNTLKNTLKNGILFCLVQILPSILMFALAAAPFALLRLSMRFLIVDLILGFSGPAFLASLYLVGLFQKYSKTDESEGESRMEQQADEQDAEEGQDGEDAKAREE